MDSISWYFKLSFLPPSLRRNPRLAWLPSKTPSAPTPYDMAAEPPAKQETPPPLLDDDAKVHVEQDKSDPASGSTSDVDDDFSAVNERTLLRKLDWRLLPAVGILYLLSFLDRSNVGNARIEGLATDLHMTGNQYLTGLTLYFVGYVIFEVSHKSGLRRKKEANKWG